VLSREDALKAKQIGCGGVIVSNHGGRQLDGAVSPLIVLPDIADAVGDDLTILCDSGFRRGSAIIKAIARGAKAVMVGRSTLYAVAAAGGRGVNHEIDILKNDIIRTMTLLGASKLSEIDNSKVLNLTPRLSELQNDWR
jgi:isopentenyl diphosphate isomerase/L-lactate dehydrogenase-like FMN-dependent dehydrogenase